MGSATILETIEPYPRLKLGTYPTPVRAVAIESGCSFWVKEDGCSSDVYGGNKLRKLEYLLADALRRGVSRLVVQGDIRSHTTVACALHARRQGLEVVAVVYAHGKRPPALGTDSRLHDCGAQVVRTPGFLTMLLVARLLSCRKGTYLVPFGCSQPLTTLGHIRAVAELCDQIRAGELPAPDLLFVAHASGGTVAGLLIGLALADLPCRVVAVQTVEPAVSNRGRIERLVKATLDLLPPSDALFSTAMEHLEKLEPSYIGGGYFSPSARALRAISRVSPAGLRLDSAFTGKAMAAMLDAMAAAPHKRYLFWNTNDAAHEPEPSG